MKRKHNVPSNATARKVACTVSAAALMLGVSQAATVGFNFQVDWTELTNGVPSPRSSPAYTGKPATAMAFGVDTNGWQNLTPMPTGYNFRGDLPGPFTNNEVIDTTTATGGLNPLPNGSLNVTWISVAGNASGFAGYGPPYGAPNPHAGDQEIYYGFLRDDANVYTSPTSTPGYSVTITGLRSVWTNHPFAIELVSSTDTGNVITNAFITSLTSTQAVTYDVTNASIGIMGGLSTMSGPWTNDSITISGAPATSHSTGYAIASTIAGFIITDKPIISMPPNPVVVCPGDTVVWSGYAVGVPPLSYQWRKNGVAIPGATSMSLGLTNVTPADVGSYDLLVTNLYGSAVSAPVSIDHLSITQGNNYVVDSNPSNPPLDGLDFGATWLASSGAQSGVMSFNATNGNQIVVPGHTNLNSSVGAIMFWMRSNGTTNVSSGAAMLFDRHVQGSSGLVIAQNTNGTLQVNTRTSGDRFDSSSTVSDGNWHHVAVVFDQAASGAVKLYIDGQFDNGVANAVAWSWPAGQELEFGLSHDTASWQAYNGLMDDIRYYNRLLTDAEVLTIFNSGSTVDNTSLMLRLNFDTAPVAGVTLTWQCTDGLLQSSTTAGTGYTDMPYAVSPYATSLRTAAKYFRYKADHTPATLIANPYRM